MKMTRFSCFLGTLLITACTSVPTAQTYSGKYFYNFEWASFFPDGEKDVRWCVEGDMSRAELPGTPQSGPWGTSHVVVEGSLGPLGSYGNLGACKRILTVTKIVKITDMRGQE